jgi:hypothetical protein
MPVDGFVEELGDCDRCGGSLGSKTWHGGKNGNWESYKDHNCIETLRGRIERLEECSHSPQPVILEADTVTVSPGQLWLLLQLATVYAGEGQGSDEYVRKCREVCPQIVPFRRVVLWVDWTL